jgi:hypothetical protein
MREISAVITMGQNSESGVPQRLCNCSRVFPKSIKLSACACSSFCFCGSVVVEASEQVGAGSGSAFGLRWMHHVLWPLLVGSRQYVQALYVSME